MRQEGAANANEKDASATAPDDDLIDDDKKEEESTTSQQQHQEKHHHYHRSPPVVLDPRNASRDDSYELDDSTSEDYFLRNNGNGLSSPAATAAVLARTPPRVMSSNSLYGEDFVSTSRHSYILDPSPSSRILDETKLDNDKAVGQQEERQLQHLLLNQPFLLDDGVQTAHSNDNDDEDEDDDDDNLMMVLSSPDNALLLSPADRSEMTTPPSVQYPPSLSPPRLEQHHGFSASAFVETSLPPPTSIASSMMSRVSKNSNSNNKKKKNRPPRAPPNYLRMTANQQAIGGSISYIQQQQQLQDRHIRAHSTGDASFLSALTDPDYNESGGAGIGGGMMTTSTSGGSLSAAATNNVLSGMTSTTNTQQQQQPLMLQADDERDWEPATPPPVQEGMMDFEIPSSLQQPVLCDDDDDDGEEIEPIDMTSNDQVDDKNVVNEKEKSPIRRSPVTPPKRIAHPKPPFQINNRCEFEAEAQAALFSAMVEDDAESGDDGDEIDKKLFANPTRNNDTASIKHSLEEERGLSMTTTTMAHCLALQHASASQYPGKEQGLSQLGSGDADLLVSNANTLLIATQQQQQQKMKRRRPVRSTAAANSEEAPIELSTTRDEDDTAMDDAEGGISTKTGAFHAIQESAVHASVSQFDRNVEQTKADWSAFEQTCRSRKGNTLISYSKNWILFSIVPSLAIASILFYGVNNPLAGNGEIATRASFSWWLLFIGCRQTVVFSLARATDFLFSHYLGTASPRFMKLVGPRAGFFLAQSKGFPSVLILWGLYCLILLYGNGAFAKQWLFWQNKIDLFNSNNPAGDITARDGYLRCIIVSILFGFCVALKRVWMGYHLGRRLYSRYNDELRCVMQKVGLLTRLAAWTASQSVGSNIDDKVAADETQQNDTATERSVQIDILARLEEWEEPKLAKKVAPAEASIQDILAFRKASLLLQSDYPFSNAFGPANTRKACASSSAHVYRRLLGKNEGESLTIGTLEEVSDISYGSLVFRPESDEVLSLFNFTKGVDDVYRELRTLSANIRNFTDIDRVYERFVNCAFYIIIGFIALAIIGLNILAFALAVASIVIAISFVIGSASRATLEGILLVLVHRPYDIGDRIAISTVNDESPMDNSFGSIVEDISLFHTTVRCGLTREIATITNGSLAKSRIINMRRSDKAQICINVKFGVDVPNDTIVLFRKAVEKFVQDRPQAFVNSVGFRIARVESDLGFIEYVIVLQSHESWQSVSEVLESKAKVSRFCVELQKQLGLNLNVSDANRNHHSEPCKNATRDITELAHSSGGRRDSDLVFSLKSEDGAATAAKRNSGSVASRDDNDDGNHDEAFFHMAQLFETKKSK